MTPTRLTALTSATVALALAALVTSIAAAAPSASAKTTCPLPARDSSLRPPPPVNCPPPPATDCSPATTVTLDASRHAIHPRQRLVLNGTVSGANPAAGLWVQLQVRQDGRWRAILGGALAGADGRFEDAYRFHSSGAPNTYRFRARVRPQPGSPCPAASAPVRVRLTGRG